MTLTVAVAWLRANGVKLLLGALACAIIALPIVLMLPKTYESTATLLVFPPAFKEDPRPSSTREAAPAAQGVADMSPRTLPMEAYKALALSPPLIKQVIDKLTLANTGVDKLQRRLEVELVQMGSRSAQTGVTYTQALLFHATAKSPEEAADVAQTWAEEFKEQVDGLARNGMTEAFTLLESLHATLKTELEACEKAIADHEKTFDLELMKAKRTSKQRLLTELEAQLKQGEIKIASAESRVRILEEELGKEEKKEVFFRAPSDDVYWLAGVDPAVPEKGLRTEEANPNYVSIRSSLVTVREDLESLRSGQEATRAKIAELNGEIQSLAEVVAEQSMVRDRLSRELETVRVNYGVARGEYEKGRMANQTQASDIVISGSAVVSDEPSGPRSTSLLLAAALAGSIVTGGFVLLRDLSERPSAAPAEASGATNVPA